MKTAKIPPELCVRCRGGSLLCGLPYCPIVSRSFKAQVVSSLESRVLEGSSPPSIFVGRAGYPVINVYVASPPVKGDTSLYESPSRWLSLALDEFLVLRYSLVRGGIRSRVHDASNPSGELYNMQITALSSAPIDIEVVFSRPPSRRIVFDDHSPPFGPSAPLERFRFGGNPRIDRVVDRVYLDRDLKASEAVWRLYSRGVDVSKISMILSVGGVGIGRRRRIVPTRWAITATDKALSDRLVSLVKNYPVIDRYYVYVRRVEGNLFTAILSPDRWMFEWGEAWFPYSTWNLWGSDPVVEVDYELYGGRDSYPDIGGCYYASRLAVAEHLYRIGRQASAILWREIYPGFIHPVGVWFVRENIRAMLSSEPKGVFDSLDDALRFVSGFLRVPIDLWIARSGLVRIKRSRKIFEYRGSSR